MNRDVVIQVNRVLKVSQTALQIAGLGIVLVALYWSLYVGMTYLLERLLSQGDPQFIRQDLLRNSLALVVSVITILLMRTTLRDTVKATLLLAGLTVFLMALVLCFYQMMGLAVGLVILVSGIIILVINKQKKPWFYNYAVGVAILVALLYAWPR